MTSYDIIGKRVDSLACNQCGTVMDVRESEPFSIVQCPRCGTQQAVPKKLGDFLLLRFLGKGGMGAVFQGYDTRLGRQVAIKVLGKLLGDDPSAMDNFLREARAAAQINSPYVVQIFQVGEERNKPFIVMELISGGQLDQLIEHQPLSELRALEVCRDAAMGLQSAQEIGLFHGDIKPENILFDQHQNAKIADFGLAQFIQRGQKSKPGEIWGTPYYIAPEKARKQQEDYRSDIYSLGATLFHALTGQPPFEGDSAADVVLARLKSYAPSIRDIKPSLNEATAKLVARMLEPDPAMRYPNYTSLLSDLDSVISAVKNKTVAAAAPAKKRKPLRLVIPLLLLTAVGAAVFFLTRPDDRVFTEEEQQVLIREINGWTKNIYRFEPSALHGVESALEHVQSGLPAEHPGRNWLPVLRSTFQLLALNTNELTNTLSGLLGKDQPPVVDGKPNPAFIPLNLARFLISTNTTYAPGPGEWPAWHRDLARYIAAVKLLSRAEYEEANGQFDEYTKVRPPDDSERWPYAFQSVAVTLSDNIKKWNTRQALLDKFIARGNSDKALEKLESYEAGNPPIFADFIERNKARLGKQPPAAGAVEQPPPQDAETKRKAEEAIRKAEDESRRQREQAAREALKKQEEQKQNQQLQEEARKEKERLLQVDADADRAALARAMAAVRPFVVQRNYQKAKESIAGVPTQMKTEDGRRDAQQMAALLDQLESLDQMLVDQIGSTQIPPAVAKMLGGEPKKADRSGILITLTHGESVKPWEQIGNPLYIKLAETVLDTSTLPGEIRGKHYMALAFFCKAIQAPKTWVTRYSKQALECAPFIGADMNRGLGLLNDEP